MQSVSKLRGIYVRHPILRGMVAYGVLWPTSSIIQQGIHDHSGRTRQKLGITIIPVCLLLLVELYVIIPFYIKPINWPRAIRFGIIGSCFVAPCLYLWVRYTSRVFPGKDIKTAIKKALLEQVSYGPFALSGIFFGLSALEGQSFTKCVDEVKQKFLPTFKLYCRILIEQSVKVITDSLTESNEDILSGVQFVGVCVWPVIQTVNYYFIPEKNRVVFVSIMSVLWTCFLSHMKSLSKDEIEHRRN